MSEKYSFKSSDVRIKDEKLKRIIINVSDI